MNRKSFIKSTLLTGAAGALAPQLLHATRENTIKSAYAHFMQQVGYNHLPNQEERNMNTVIHKSNTRGHANHGWLDTYHTFSFANYHNPERMNFGVLRVLNDDTVMAGQGFGTHPHDNMEIISIPLEGDLEHKDSMGNVKVIKQGDVQVMSAGSGITHSEYNKNSDKDVKFLQIWLFPKEQNVQPRYDQISISDLAQENKFYQILSPHKDDPGVWIHQDAWFSLGNFEKGAADVYRLNKKGNGIYLFVLEGDFEVEGQSLGRRDGMGIWDQESVNLEAKSENSRVLLMEVPMAV